jgi:imidazolonepropionase-like amidohydrolase
MKTAFKNANLIDGLGSQKEKQAVIIEDKKILGIGNEDIIPADIHKIIDLKDKVLMPGMIDTHIHVTGGNVLPQYPDYISSRRLNEPLGLHAYRTYKGAKQVLLTGVTTIRDVGGREFLDVDLRDAIEEGIITGPRVIASGLGITPTGGHIHYRCKEVDGVNEIIKEVRNHVKRGVDCIKIMGLTGGMSSAGQDVGATQFRFGEVQAAVEEAKRWGKLTACHAHGIEGIMNAINAGVTTLDHGIYLNDEAAKLMAEKEIYYVPTLLTHYNKNKLDTEGKLPETIKQRYRELEDMGIIIPSIQEIMGHALKHKVKILMGTDCGGNVLSNLGDNAWELVAMVEAGMSPMEAIISATGRAAEALRIQKITGSIEAGKYADMLVVGKNPLEDIRAMVYDIEMVIKEGKIITPEMFI